MKIVVNVVLVLNIELLIPFMVAQYKKIKNVKIYSNETEKSKGSITIFTFEKQNLQGRGHLFYIRMTWTGLDRSDITSKNLHKKCNVHEQEPLSRRKLVYALLSPSYCINFFLSIVRYYRPIFCIRVTSFQIKLQFFA